MKYYQIIYCLVFALIAQGGFVFTSVCSAQTSMPSAVDVRLVTDEPEAVLDILNKRKAKQPITEADWERVFQSEGYVRLKKRELAMKRSFEDADFRTFVLSDKLAEQSQLLEETLERWKHADMSGAARLALAYLPSHAQIKAKIFPEIKPRENSFVFDTKTDPAIFLYLDPKKSKEKFENDVAHEMHHIGYSTSCPSKQVSDEISKLPQNKRIAVTYIGAFGEGFAMLAAAGGPGTHPHAVSSAEERARWDKDVANFNGDLKTVEKFFLDVLDNRLTEDEIRKTAASFFGVQGPWYTVGWKMSVVIERTLGKAKLIECICDQRKLLPTYNQAAAKYTRRTREPLALWSESLLKSVESTSAVARDNKRAEPLNHRADFTQAELVLNLLRSSVGGNVHPQMIESVLQAHGTDLIISQQNISRTVTKEQYRALLLALNGKQPPEITPVEPTERSRRGVDGLRKDVWPALRWGETNTALLAQRIEEIRQLGLYRNSQALASRFLPEPVVLAPHLYVVMGGRAGAAALDGDEIYFDVLITSYRAANGALRYPDPSQVNEFFAHETHHIGLSQILNRKRRQLRLSNQEQRAFDFLTALVMEGSASYLINGHRSLEVMSRDPQFTDGLKKGNELIKLSGEILRSVLDNNLNGEAYETATTPFLGSGWHSAGATMLAAIDQAGGLQRVMKVLRDPRKLLVAYNQAVAKLKAKQERFDTGLAIKVSSIGEGR